MRTCWSIIRYLYLVVLRLVWAGRARQAPARRPLRLFDVVFTVGLVGLFAILLLSNLLAGRNRVWLRTTDAVVVAFDPTGELLATGHTDGRVRLWDAMSGAPGGQWDITPDLGNQDGLTRPVEGVIFAPSGELLATWDIAGVLQVWRVEDGTLLHTFALDTGGGIGDVRFSPDSSLTAAGTSVHNATTFQVSTRLWRLADGALIRTLPDDFGNLLAFAPDGQTLATASAGTVRLWRVANGTLLRTIDKDQGEQLGWVLTFVPDLQMFVTYESSLYDDNYTLRVWRLADKSLLHTLQQQGQIVQQGVISQDGSLLAVALDRSNVHLWSLKTGTWHDSSGTRVNRRGATQTALSTDGHYMAMVSGAAVQVWRVAPPPPVMLPTAQ